MAAQNLCGDVWGYRIDSQTFLFEPEVWYQFEHRIVMNAPGGATGILEGWINGQPALQKTGLRFRTVDTFAVDQFFFSTFYGGGDETYAPLTDQTIFFDDFICATQPTTH